MYVYVCLPLSNRSLQGGSLCVNYTSTLTFISNVSFAWGLQDVSWIHFYLHRYWAAIDWKCSLSGSDPSEGQTSQPRDSSHSGQLASHRTAQTCPASQTVRFRAQAAQCRKAKWVLLFTEMNRHFFVCMNILTSRSLRNTIFYLFSFENAVNYLRFLTSLHCQSHKKNTRKVVLWNGSWDVITTT